MTIEQSFLPVGGGNCRRTKWGGNQLARWLHKCFAGADGKALDELLRRAPDDSKFLKQTNLGRV